MSIFACPGQAQCYEVLVELRDVVLAVYGGTLGRTDIFK